VSVDDSSIVNVKTILLLHWNWRRVSLIPFANQIVLYHNTVSKEKALNGYVLRFAWLLNKHTSNLQWN
jgi:hypothetical protein